MKLIINIPDELIAELHSVAHADHKSVDQLAEAAFYTYLDGRNAYVEASLQGQAPRGWKQFI